MTDFFLPAVRQLEQALADGDRPVPEDYCHRLDLALQRLEGVVRQHAADLEIPCGVFDLVCRHRPVVRQQVHDLRQDHDRMLADIGTLRERTRGFCGEQRRGSWDVNGLNELSARADDFYRQLVRHWEEEADLVIESLIREIGGRQNPSLDIVKSPGLESRRGGMGTGPLN